MPIITAAINDVENSVMITGINEFQNRHHRGAIMRMNSDGVIFVSSFIMQKKQTMKDLKYIDKCYKLQ